jgi:two-component system sensor histidine kinase BaeS
LRPNITFKLFLAILATCIVVALAMGMAVRYSFESGFSDYVQEREDLRLDNLAAVLESGYAESNSWEFLAGNRHLWWRSLRFSRRAALGEHGRSHAEAGGPLPRVTLVDARGNWLAGPRLAPDAAVRRHPLVVDGRRIGWLLTPPPAPKVINDDVDRKFQSRQLRATWLIVAFSVLLAALASLLLARILLGPVRRLARATHSLAGGDYQTRVRVGPQDELGRLARDFNQLAHSLERNERLRRDLMADVSHELRTPLAVLRGEVEALQDGLRPLNAQALQSLGHEVVQLSKLVDDLYELSLADAGALNYRMAPLNLSTVLNDAVDTVQERFARKGLDIERRFDTDLPMRGDQRRLTQLFANLLENSARYTDAPGRVRIRAWRDGTSLKLEIADSAPGVPAPQQAHLFERLYRAEASRSRQHGGAGLGLAICSRIVQAHGGEITAADSDLGGLAIRVQWPLEQKASNK